MIRQTALFRRRDCDLQSLLFSLVIVEVVSVSF